MLCGVGVKPYARRPDDLGRTRGSGSHHGVFVGDGGEVHHDDDGRGRRRRRLPADRPGGLGGRHRPRSRAGCRSAACARLAGWSTHPHWDHLLWSAAFGGGAEVRDAARGRGRRRGSGPGSSAALTESAPGHDLTLFARVDPAARPRNRLGRARARSWYPHDAHAPGHGAVLLPERRPADRRRHALGHRDPAAYWTSESADPFGDYRSGLELLAAAPGVHWVVPGHGHVGDRAEFTRRVGADRGYLDATEAGADVADPRLSQEWLRAEHARQRERRPHTQPSAARTRNQAPPAPVTKGGPPRRNEKRDGPPGQLVYSSTNTGISRSVFVWYSA